MYVTDRVFVRATVTCPGCNSRFGVTFHCRPYPPLGLRGTQALLDDIFSLEPFVRLYGDKTSVCCDRRMVVREAEPELWGER